MKFHVARAERKRGFERTTVIVDEYRTRDSRQIIPADELQQISDDIDLAATVCDRGFSRATTIGPAGLAKS